MHGTKIVLMKKKHQKAFERKQERHQKVRARLENIKAN